MTDPRARLVSLLGPVVAGAGADLEDLHVSPAGRRRLVRVVVDKDGGVSLDDVADISRAVSEALDEAEVREPDLLDGAYVLEVSSPGVDRPLTEPRHWRRNAGRLVTATLFSGGPVTGRVLRVEPGPAGDDDGDSVVLDVGGRERFLPLARVRKGVVQVEFERKATPGGDPQDEAVDVAEDEDDLVDGDGEDEDEDEDDLDEAGDEPGDDETDDEPGHDGHHDREEAP